jgi:hypothetical protein
MRAEIFIAGSDKAPAVFFVADIAAPLVCAT